MIFVDTGAWYARYIIDDVDHDRANKWFCNVSERLVTTDYILDELFTLMNVRGHGSVAIAAGELLFTEGPCELEYVGFADLFIPPAMIAKSWYSVGFSRMVFG